MLIRTDRLSTSLTKIASWAIVTIFLVGTAPFASAACPLRSGDRVLLVSTRPVGCTTSIAKLESRAYGAERSDGTWKRSDPVELLASIDPSLPTVVYVHGNQIEANDARRRGLDVYQSLVRKACDARSIQYVIFSWASAKVPGMLRDYREKAARTRPVALQLAWLLNRIPERAPVGLLAYSYGTRVTSGAAHLLAGGSLSGLVLPEPVAQRPMRSVFLAAAEDACWLAPTRYHGLAMHQIESLLVTTNPKDPAMRLFKFVSKTSDPSALGGVGPMGLSAEYASRIQTRGVSQSVGRSHDLYRYLAVPGLMRSSWQRLTFANRAETAVPSLASR